MSIFSDAGSEPVLAPGRVCGTCTACCKIMSFEGPGFQKNAGTMCQHCTGLACGIHPTRPDACKQFHCLWREVASMPDSIRPDRIGVMFTIESMALPSNPFEREFVMARALNSPADFEHPGAKAAFDVFVTRGDLPIWRSAGGHRTLFHPHAALRDAIVSRNPPAPALAQDVQVWRQRLGL